MFSKMAILKVRSMTNLFNNKIGTLEGFKCQNKKS